MADENLDNETLDQHLDQAASDAAAFNQFQNVDWPALNDSEFQRMSQKVFSQMESLAKLRHVASEVRDIDAAAEARKHQKAETGDINVTFNR